LFIHSKTSESLRAGKKCSSFLSLLPLYQINETFNSWSYESGKIPGINYSHSKNSFQRFSSLKASEYKHNLLMTADKDSSCACLLHESSICFSLTHTALLSFLPTREREKELNSLLGIYENEWNYSVRTIKEESIR
jgi:hypothetical protein